MRNVLSNDGTKVNGVSSRRTFIYFVTYDNKYET